MRTLNDKTGVGMCVDDWPAGTVSSTNGDSLSLLQEASSSSSSSSSSLAPHHPFPGWRVVDVDLLVVVGGLRPRANISPSDCAPTPVLRRPCHGGRVDYGPLKSKIYF